MNSSHVSPQQVGVWAPLGRMKLSPYARKHSPEDIASRAGSMARDGQLQNAIVVKVDDPNFPDNWVYELVVGHGRYESAKAGGWEAIKVDIYEHLTEGQKLSMALAENSEREEASPLYTASLYQAIMDAEGIDQATLAERLGKGRSVVVRYLALNGLGPDAQHTLEASGLGIGHCREFTRLASPQEQLQFAHACLKGDWSVRELQARVDAALKGGGQADSQESVTANPKPPFQFKQKKESIALKVRAFEPQCETFEDYIRDLIAAYQEFAARQATPEAPVVQEEAQAQVAA